MTDDYDHDEFNNLDEPKDTAKILKGRKIRIPFRPYMEDNYGNYLYRIRCRNGCHKSDEDLVISPNESDESISEKVKQLLNFPCDDATFEQSFIEKEKRKKENPLNDPTLSKSEKLAYVDSLDWEEDAKELLKDSIEFEDSM